MKRKQLLQITNWILWISLIFASFSCFSGPLKLTELTQVNEIYHFIVNADYSPYILWSITILTLYFLVKGCIILIIPKLITSGGKVHKMMLKIDLRVPIQDFIHRGENSRSRYKNTVVSYAKEINEKENLQIIENSQLLVSIFLKVLIISCIKWDSSITIHPFMSFLGIMISFTILILLQLTIINSKREITLKHLIRDFLKM